MPRVCAAEEVCNTTSGTCSSDAEGGRPSSQECSPATGHSAPEHTRARRGPWRGGGRNTRGASSNTAARFRP
eukprot:scaffold8020_cov390-Prasinococcus_capsulatus_cf.AAC.1